LLFLVSTQSGAMLGARAQEATMSNVHILRRSILSALGLSSVALTAACQPDWTDKGGGDEGSASAGDEGGEGGGTDSGGGGNTDDYGLCDPTEVDALPSYGDLVEQSGGEPVTIEQVYCVDHFQSAEDCMACDQDCEGEISGAFSEEHSYSGWGYDLGIDCGPMWLDGECCFVARPMSWDEGRPFRIAGKARRAEATFGDRWAPEVSVQPISRKLRRRLAKHWTNQGLAEHASVASFSRFSLQLMALGAPPELLAETARAMVEEIDHARRCFALASAYGDSPVGPGPIDTTDAQGSTDALTVLLETFTDGCINESMAAAEAQLLAERVTDPVLRETLQCIAEDETRHAALAWKTVRWILQRHPELQPTLVEAWVRIRANWDARLERLAAQDPTPELDAHGVLNGPGRAQLGTQVLTQVIAPCLGALVESGSHERVSST
jgi:hypothetical protein